VNIRRLSAFLLVLLGNLLAAAEIGIGDTRESVLAQLGKPTSIARRGEHEIFLYPKGGRIEFVGGKVTDVKGPLPAPMVAPTEPGPPATVEPAPATDAPPKVSPKNVPVKREAPQTTFEDYNPSVAANELAKHVEKMDTPWGMAPPKEEVHSPLDALPEFLTGLLIRFIFTLIALKLAFKYWEMDAFWKGTFMIAGIDLAIHAIAELLAPVTHGFTTMVGVENGIAGLVLIYTIHRFCFNKRIQNAVLTAAVVKLVVTLCYIFAGVGALNMIYG
jgi:hypothetical protein